MQETTFHHFTLPNGLTVIGERNPRALSFAAGFFVKAGARDEQADVSGVSHFLEHMMFKGTERRSAEDISLSFDELGASYNAFTSEEATVYYGAVLKEAAPQLLDLLTDMMRPALRQADFDIEKNVILEEIAMYEDSPLHRLLDLSGPQFHAGHPLGNSILGTVESITTLERDRMYEYFEQRYAADNLTLAVAGNFDWQELLDHVSRLTGHWKPSRAGRDYPEPRPAAGFRVETDPRLTRTHLALHAPAVSAQSPLRHAATLLGNVLGDDGGRLHWSLIDPGLADSAFSQYDGSDGAGSFISYVSTAPEHAEDVRRLLQDELEKIQDERPTESEWQAARNRVATALTLGAETPFRRLMSLGNSWLYRGEYVSVADAVERYLTCSVSDLDELLEDRPFDTPFVMQLGPA